MRAVMLYPGDEVAHLVEVAGSGHADDNSKFYGAIDTPIDFRFIGPGWGMYFDDEFLIKKLPFNKIASMLYRFAGYTSPICGPAIVVGITDDGDNTDVPAPALHLMAALGLILAQETDR